MSAPPAVATDAVLALQGETPEDAVFVRGHDFNEGTAGLLEKYMTMGFQGTNLGKAVEEINRMRKWRMSDAPVRETDKVQDPEERKNVKTKIFLGFTSNLISSGVREQLVFMMKHRMIDVLVTTAGGVEEDFIKCLAPTYLGDWSLKGKELRSQGLNRIGNLLVPNDNYCKFEDWMMPILDAMKKEQDEDGVRWTPSRVIRRLGAEIDDPRSVYYWAAKHDIPVYCPALTDGSIGDMLYFHSFNNPGLVVDLVEDIRAMNDEARLVTRPRKTGMLVLGGGVAKHHINNANLMRNGADFSVSINTVADT